MAILTSSQQTFVDITDQRKLSAYITSNLPKSQIENPNVLPHTYAPDWASTPLTLTLPRWYFLIRPIWRWMHRGLQSRGNGKRETERRRR